MKAKQLQRDGHWATWKRREREEGNRKSGANDVRFAALDCEVYCRLLRVIAFGGQFKTSNFEDPNIVVLKGVTSREGAKDCRSKFECYSSVILCTQEDC